MAVVTGGRCSEVPLFSKCGKRYSKNSGRCREVVVSLGLTVIYIFYNMIVKKSFVGTDLQFEEEKKHKH